MRALEKLLEQAGRHFEPGKPLHRFHALYEAADTFAMTPPTVTRGTTHVRDALDLKRMMMIVVIAMMPCVLMAMYNTGLQANLGIDPARAAALEGWRHDGMRLAGVGYSPENFWACLVHGSLYFWPLYIVTMAAGGFWEVLFAIVRRMAKEQIDKSSRFTDWSRRPLTEKQLLYALADVTHLRIVYEGLKKELDKTGREHWLSEAMDIRTNPATYPTEP